MGSKTNGKALGHLERILVATDFSIAARAAFDWGLHLARMHGASVDLLHVGTEGDALPKAASDALAEMEHAAEEAGVVLARDLRPGIPWKIIPERARALPADVVVVGTRGMTALPRLLLGSTADRVIRSAPGPVLTVPPSRRNHAPATKTVLVATDFSEESDLALRALLRLVKPAGPSVRVVLMHACHAPGEYVVTEAAALVTGDLSPSAEEMEERLETIAAPLRAGGWNVETAVSEGYAVSAIDATMRKLRADLVALGTVGQSRLSQLMLGSTVERVLHRATCPVLTARRTAPAAKAVSSGRTTAAGRKPPARPAAARPPRR